MVAITRRTVNKAALAAAATLAAPSILRSQTPPNLVVIIQDDQNAFSSASDGYPLLKDGLPYNITPNATRLATTGVRFKNAFAGTPYCSSSRSEFLSGLRPDITGVYSQGMDWAVGSTIAPESLGDRPPQKLLFRFLKENGYDTFGTGKVTHKGWAPGESNKGRKRLDPDAWTHFENCGGGDCDAPVQKGEGKFPNFTVGNPYIEIPDSIRADWAIDKVLTASHSRPFALFFGVSNPHLPWDASQEFYDALSPSNGVADIPYPMGVRLEDQRPDVTATTNWDLRDEPHGANAMLDQHSFADSFGTKDTIGIIKSGQWKAFVKAYLAEMMSSDRTIGRLLDNIPSNTVVVLISDHGWMLGEKLGWRKFTLWETATKVPFVISGPGVSTGVCTNPIGLVDMFPTVCDLLFGQVPTKADLGKFDLSGASRKSWITGDPAAYHYNVVLSQWQLKTGEIDTIRPNPTNANLAIRDNHHRLIQYDGGGRSLYAHSGVRNDPNEWFNLVGPRALASDIAIADSLGRLFPDKSRFAAAAKNDGEEESDE